MVAEAECHAGHQAFCLDSKADAYSLWLSGPPDGDGSNHIARGANRVQPLVAPAVDLAAVVFSSENLKSLAPGLESEALR